MKASEVLIREFYQAFNERRLEEAAALFTPDAVLHHAPLMREERGPQGALFFMRHWLAAFPDTAITVERIIERDRTCEVDLLARGTHLGALDMSGCGVFKPTAARASLHMRHLLEIRGGAFTFSSLSFDLQEIVQQLVTVDYPRLHEHLQRIQQLSEKLQAIRDDDLVERRALVDRLGRELDAARRIVRPYFSR
jgi:hypothetical protein